MDHGRARFQLQLMSNKMTETPIDDLNMLKEKPLVTPAALKSLFPLAKAQNKPSLVTANDSLHSVRKTLITRGGTLFDSRYKRCTGVCGAS